MAQKQSSKNSEGMCMKIRNAVSNCPIKAKIHQISHKPHQPHDSSSKPHTTKNWARASPTPNKPVHVLHQSKTIPIEIEPHISRSSPQTNGKPAGNASSINSFHDFVKRDIVIANSQNSFINREFSQPKKSEHAHDDRVPIAKTKTKKDDDSCEDHEGKFSDYINKVKRRMIKTMTINYGGGISATRRDSFNDKVVDYINHAKNKIRTSTIVGDQNK